LKLEKIKQLRKEKKLTQMEIAIKVGISLVAYQLIERGVTKTPRKETLKKIKKVLGA